MTEKELLTKQILENIENLDIAGYLKEEIAKFL
jgi:hypothetical protein